MISALIPFAFMLAVFLVIAVGLTLVFRLCYVKVPQGRALIVSDTTATPKVSFTRALVLPLIHQKEFLNISLISFKIERQGRGSLRCRDNFRVEMDLIFYLRVNPQPEDVLAVAGTFGVQRASDPAAVREIFAGKFSEALEAAVLEFDRDSLFEDRLKFRDRMVELIGRDLNGFSLEDLAIEKLAAAPPEVYDQRDPADAEALRRLAELVGAEQLAAAEERRQMEMLIKDKEIEVRERMRELERQQAEAEARHQRELESLRSPDDSDPWKR